MKETPKQFVNRWCAENGIDMLAMLAAARSRARRDLCVVLKQHFAELSSTQIGLLLGVDHSTVVYAWSKAGLPKGGSRRPIPEATIARIRELAAQGLRNVDIAKAVGCSHVAVGHILRPDRAALRKQKKRAADVEMTERRHVLRAEAEKELWRKRGARRKALDDRRSRMI